MKIDVRLYLPLVKKEIACKIQSFSKETIWTRGVGSRIYGTAMHMLSLDYDRIMLRVLLLELEFLREVYEPGNFYVLKTKENGYHAECVDHFTAKEVVEIQDASSCDRVFTRGPLFNDTRSWYLRNAPKGDRAAPTLAGVVESPYEGNRMQSTFHAGKLSELIGREVKLVNPDGIQIGYIDEYETPIKGGA